MFRTIETAHRMLIPWSDLLSEYPLRAHNSWAFVTLTSNATYNLLSLKNNPGFQKHDLTDLNSWDPDASKDTQKCFH